jgi:hypothetical protein
MKKLFKKLFVTGTIIAGSIGAISAQNASVQVIHNCAAPAADSVDVYVDGTLTLTSFAFRTATPFISLPAGVTYNIGIAAAHSTGVADTLKNFAVGPLSSDSSYILVASGVVGTGFAANPNSISTALSLDVIAHALTSATTPGNVSLGVFHGVTDAPAVDVDLTRGATLVSDIEYGQFQGYLSVPATWYPISIAPTGTQTYVANYTADLSSLADSAVVVLASGFLTPASNNNGPAFGLIAVLPNGTVINLPLQQQSLVQVIHNAPDPAADTVDVYVDGAKAIPSFAFRTATPFIPLLSNVNHSIAVAPNHSTSVSQALATFNNINLQPDSNYVVTASGVVGSGFAPNPEGISTAFTLLVKEGAELQAQTAGNFDFFAIHGSPDAPTVDIRVEGGPIIVNDASYTAQTGYLRVPAGTYTLDVQDSTGTITIARYSAPLGAFTDSSAVVLASGFLDPAANNNGPAFGLWVALPSGGNLIPLTNTTGIKNISNEIGLKYYPNPASGQLNVSFVSPSPATVNITDLSGNVVESLAGSQGKNSLDINVNGLSEGMYILHVVTSAGSSNEKFAVIK